MRGCLQNLYQSVAIHLKYVLLVVYQLASYPGPFTRAVRAMREIRAWYQSFAHALNFTGILVK